MHMHVWLSSVGRVGRREGSPAHGRQAERDAPFSSSSLFRSRTSVSSATIASPLATARTPSSEMGTLDEAIVWAAELLRGRVAGEGARAEDPPPWLEVVGGVAERKGEGLIWGELDNGVVGGGIIDSE